MQRLAPGLRVEVIGADVLVLDRAGAVVHRVAGRAAEVLMAVRDGALPEPLPTADAHALADLVRAGVVTVGTLSRRRLMLWAGTATGITTMALPSPAAAASVCPEGVTPTAINNNGFFQSASPSVLQQFTTGPGVTSIRVEMCGGGGGQGFGVPYADLQYGGAGGGGAYASKIVAVSPCTTYSFRVGAGGLRAITVGTTGYGTDGDDTVFYSDPAGTVEEFRAHGGKTGTPTSGGAGGSASVGSGVTSYTGGDGGNPYVNADNALRAAGGGGGAAGSGGAGGNGGDASAATGGTPGAGASGSFPGGVGGGGSSTAGFLEEPDRQGGLPGGGPGGGRSGEGASGRNGRIRITPL